MKQVIRRSAVLLFSLGLLGVGSLGLTASANAAAAAAIDAAPMASDGVRYFAYKTPKRAVVVLDTWKQETNLIRGAANCRPLDVGGSRVLLRCGKIDSNFMGVTKTASARGGKVRLLPHNKSGYWHGIGKYWVEGNTPCTGTGGCLGGRAYVNWRTGKTGYPDGELTDWSRADLDRKRLLYISPRFIPAGFAKSWKLCWDENTMVTDAGRIRVWSSHSDSMVIGNGGLLEYECDNYSRLQVGSGRVVWNRGRVIHEYNTVNGMSYKRRLKKPTRIVPVRDGAVIAMRVRDGETHDRYRIRFIALP
ncbi:MAG: hypothetical protein KDB48_06745 [Solirubrobacterales bacterium]|nr:hypothetical protein [Solirubrobacterales bacterium]MCB0868375.1 hypothetical protein [Solirubrobacterales bacterium]